MLYTLYRLLAKEIINVMEDVDSWSIHSRLLPPPQKKNSGVHSCGQPTEKYGKNKKTLTLPKVVMCGPQVW